MIDIVSITQLLEMNLAIPDYQRPYKWAHRNMVELLDDISDAITNADECTQFRYRVGTIILHEVHRGKDTEYYIVDGQQRILSLVLILLCLKADFTCPLLEKSTFSNRITQTNLHRNYAVAREYLASGAVSPTQVLAALTNTVEVVVASVEKETEAFQLFDSQNTRGRGLDPQDLLKAYHLHEMQDDSQEMRHAVTKWEAVETEAIGELFGAYLFPIRNWSSGKKSHVFTEKDIDCYKGVAGPLPYTYAKRARHAMPYFQLTAPFPAGGCFFDMVSHYMEMLADVKREIATNPAFAPIKDILETRQYRSAGFSHASDLFYCALLCYYDKFRNFDQRAVKKLFTWAFMLRVDLENLGFDSVNKYAIGEEGRYTNTMPLFSFIAESRLHSDIANMPIRIRRDPDCATASKWNGLYTALKNMNGLEGTSDE